jgi:hypothetical protein
MPTMTTAATQRRVRTLKWLLVTHKTADVPTTVAHAVQKTIQIPQIRRSTGTDNPTMPKRSRICRRYGRIGGGRE